MNRRTVYWAIAAFLAGCWAVILAALLHAWTHLELVAPQHDAAQQTAETVLR